MHARGGRHRALQVYEEQLIILLVVRINAALLLLIVTCLWLHTLRHAGDTTLSLSLLAQVGAILLCAGAGIGDDPSALARCCCYGPCAYSRAALPVAQSNGHGEVF